MIFPGAQLAIPAHLLRLSVALAVALSMSSPRAAEAQDFDREVAFLTIPMGARVVGLGRAATALEGEFQMPKNRH